MKLSLLKLEIILLVTSIFLQGTAIINLGGFGIALSVFFILVIAFKYKFIITYKWSGKFLLLNCIWVIIMLIAYFINNNRFDILKILRVEMLIVSIYFLYRYIEVIYAKGKIEYLIKVIIRSSWIISIYGIYQYIGYYIRLPLFMNLVLNNSSYNIDKGLFDYYGGWASNRIYTTFAEPSFYSEFLIILILFIYMIKRNSEYKGRYLSLQVMLIINLIMTYSRSGLGEFVYIIVGIVLWNIVKNIGILKKILYVGVAWIPIINVYFIDFVNSNIFNDISAMSRADSVWYYIDIMRNNPVAFWCGNGLGSMQSTSLDSYATYYVERYAHNGYVEFIFENGIILFILLGVIILSVLKNVADETNRFILYSIIVNTNDFGTGYNIESIAFIITLVLAIMIFSNRVDEKKLC